jgi:hypothetical protein
MSKAFAIISLIIAIGLLLIFGLDASPLNIPFRGVNKTMDYGFVVCGLILAYLAWRTFREQR